MNSRTWSTSKSDGKVRWWCKQFPHVNYFMYIPKKCSFNLQQRKNKRNEPTILKCLWESDTYFRMRYRYYWKTNLNISLKCMKELLTSTVRIPFIFKRGKLWRATRFFLSVNPPLKYQISYYIFMSNLSHCETFNQIILVCVLPHLTSKREPMAYIMKNIVLKAQNSKLLNY